MQLTDQFFFDTDCLAAFLWVREESILEKLYPGKIILPAQVYEEIKKVPHLQARADKMISNGVVQVESMMVDSDEYSDYVQMTSSENSLRIIGNGEAAGIAMVKHRGGTLASNNLRDIRIYVEKYQLNHITSGDIMIEALKTGLITEDEGNNIWAEMLRRRRWLPCATFSDYLKKHSPNN